MALLFTIHDAALIERCKKGDIKSYELLYNRYSKAMYHTCMRVVFNPADAEDILQDAFLEAFTNLGRLKNKDAFGGWIKSIVLNKSINFIKRKRENWLELDTEDGQYIQEDGMIDEHEFNTQIEAIKDALAQLPIKYRTVINLHIFEKMGFEEIAALMELPASTIRSQYLRGRQKIWGLVKK